MNGREAMSMRKYKVTYDIWSHGKKDFDMHKEILIEDYYPTEVADELAKSEAQTAPDEFREKFTDTGDRCTIHDIYEHFEDGRPARLVLSTNGAVFPTVTATN